MKSKALEQIFEALYREHYVAITKIVLAVLKDHQNTEDIVQEAFTIAFSRIEELNDINKFKPWVTQIALNYARDQYKKANREFLVQNTFDDSSIAEEDLFKRILDQDELQGALNALSEKDRNLIFAKYYHDLSARQISELSGMKDATIWSQLAKIRKKLRKHFFAKE